MKVLQITESFATGTMEVVRIVAEHLAREGHRVAIAYGIRPETPDTVREQLAADVEVFQLPWTSRSVAAQLRTARALRHLCRAWRPDVVHLHSSFAGFTGSLAIASMAPTVYTPHGYSVLRDSPRWVHAAYRAAERMVARRVSMIGAVSESEARLARGFGARVVRIVPNGIPELDPGKLPEPRRSRRSRPIVAAMGRIVAQRRPVETTRILSSVSDLAEACWIGGPGPDEREERVVRAAGVPVTGWLERDEAVGRLAEATVLLHWSAWDSHPLSVLEAMAYDVLVVASDIEPNRELVESEQRCASEEDAVRLVRSALKSPDRLDRMLASQRRRRGRFGAERMAREWLEVYEELAGARVSRASRAAADYAG